jgi:hypothetical protein
MPTKAILESNNAWLLDENHRLRRELSALEKEVELTRKLVIQPIGALTIAMERVTDALAHTIAHLEKGGRR